MRENKKQAALDYLKSIHVEYDSDPVIAYCAFIAGAEWADKTMIDKFLYWLTMKSPFIDNKDMDKAIVELRKYLEE